MQTVRKRDEAPSKSASALDCNQPFSPSVSTFEEETRGFLCRCTKKTGSSKGTSQRQELYAGRIRTRTLTEEKEEIGEKSGFPSRL